MENDSNTISLDDIHSMLNSMKVELNKVKYIMKEAKLVAIIKYTMEVSIFD